MVNYEFTLTALIQGFENETWLGEALFFPEFSRYGGSLGRLRDALRANAGQTVEALPPLERYRRRDDGEPERFEAALVLEPPRGSALWREPVRLTFPAIRWRHGEEHYLAYVPALGIEIMAGSLEKLEPLIEQHLRAALLRQGAATSLMRLTWLQRCRELRVERLSFATALRSPKQVAAAASEAESAKKSVLKKVAANLTLEALRPAYEVDDLVRMLAEALAGRRPRSVLLVGPSGAGKTAILHELVRRRRDFQLERAPFYATSGSRLVAGMSGFGMWQERCRDLAREAAKIKAILHLGNLVELMEVGKSVSNSQGIAGFLRPYVARGDLLAVAECTPEQLALIERADPHLLEAFQQLRVDEPPPARGPAILRRYVAANGAPVTPDAIAALDRLHRRYATYSAYPGRPLRFLRDLLQDRPPGQSLTARGVTEAFARETGLPLFLLEETARLDLDAARQWFAERVIGQPEAVGLVVNLLATVKAGLARPHKPLASLLFIGPTGVGKTEMAKALAEFLFQDKNRMARFDMSEYADPPAVSRLIGGGYSAEGLLTARVREQPFSVILLDEFEKAHPLFFDLLLQALGEGRLTDAAGRVADFRNAVVIMTSNLGAESFQRGGVGVARGDVARERAARHFEKAVRDFVRPELFNRIDRIVAFAPLDEATVLSVAARELERLKKRDGIKYAGVELAVADEVRRHLAAVGYDPRYGARPLKRAIERELLAPLAEGLNRQPDDHKKATQPPLAGARLDGGRIAVSVIRREGASGRGVAAAGIAQQTELARSVARLRRGTQALARCPDVLNLHNEIFVLERLLQRAKTRAWRGPDVDERLARLPELKRAAEAVRQMSGRLAALEDDVLLRVYGRAEFDTAPLAAALQEATADWRELLLTVYALRFRQADRITLAVYGENLEYLFKLAAAYYELARGEGAEAQVLQYAAEPVAGQKPLTLLGREVFRRPVDHPERFLAAPREGVAGLLLCLSGPRVYLRYEGEQGMHVFKDREARRGVVVKHRLLVDASEPAVTHYKPPTALARRASIEHQPERRFYDVPEKLVRDAYLKREERWGNDLVGPLRLLLRETLDRRAASLVGVAGSSEGG